MKMRMDDIKVGMRLTSSSMGTLSPITVTELTEGGFKYCLDLPTAFIPRWGLSFSKVGHEHFGYKGETPYEVEVL